MSAPFHLFNISEGGKKNWVISEGREHVGTLIFFSRGKF